jgi:homoserine O-acetyltransferase
MSEAGSLIEPPTPGRAKRGEPRQGLGRVETRFAHLCADGLQLDCGQRLESVTVAYEQYGTLNAERDNVILICHALSGGAHAAGWSPGASKPGWWDEMIGPGKAFDTDRYCVICSNVLGSCYGTTGPVSPNPRTGRSFGTEFPVVSIRDMVAVQKHLLDALGIERLLAVAGGSMGGMLALQWAVSYPGFVGSVVALATTHRHSPQQIAFNEIARRAVMADPKWRGGAYDPADPPAEGLAVARMLGHVTYVSDRGLLRKFGRRRVRPSGPTPFAPDFDVERYLDYQGRSFVARFDANTLLYLTRAIDNFDLESTLPLTTTLAGTDAAFLLLSFSSDWLYPSAQLRTVAAAAESAGCRVCYREIPSDDGHDAFLLEHRAVTPLVAQFLSEVGHDAPHLAGRAAV